MPDPGAVPVLRAYDVGCEFAADYVEQLYGGDLVIRLQSDTGTPDGGVPGFVTSGEDGPVTTLSVHQTAWLAALDRCVGVDWAALSRNRQVRVGGAGLLADDFAGEATVQWTAIALDPAGPVPDWRRDIGGLQQVEDVPGGAVYLASGVDEPDVAVEATGWATSGSWGLVFGWRSASDHHRFEVGRRRCRLVQVEGGTARELAVAAVDVVVGQPQLIAVQVQGDRIRCQLNDLLLIDEVGAPPLGSPTGEGDSDTSVAPAGVGLYALGTTTIVQRIRARRWPGAALAPRQRYVAQVEGRRPVFADVLDDPSAVDVQVLGRSAPRVPVHDWSFTTSAYAGLPDLLDTYSGTAGVIAGTEPDVGLTARHAAAVESATTELSWARARANAAARDGDATEIGGLAAAAASAAAARDDVAADAFRDLQDALGLGFRPHPPVVELSVVTTGSGAVAALLLDLPEPLPWARMGWRLTGPDRAVDDPLVVWSGDGTRALLVHPDGSTFTPGAWTLYLALSLDVGVERPVWRRGGSSSPEAGRLTVRVPAPAGTSAPPRRQE
jgi:hypothetical protein